MDKYMEQVKAVSEKVEKVMADMRYDVNNDMIDEDKLNIYAYTLDYYGRNLKRIGNRIKNLEKIIESSKGDE